MRFRLLLGVFALASLLASCGVRQIRSGSHGDRINFERSEEIDPICNPSGSGSTLGWGASNAPSTPSEAFIILDPGHGPKADGSPTGAPNMPGQVFDGNGWKAAASVGTRDKLYEDELTLAVSLRLREVLTRLGFNVELTRGGDYGTVGECVSQSIYGSSHRCGDKNTELVLRSRRVTQILNSWGAPLVNNTILSPRFFYLSIHYNAAATVSSGAGTVGVIFGGALRGNNGDFVPNDAFTFFKRPRSSGRYIYIPTYSNSLPIHIFDHMVASLRKHYGLPELQAKSRVNYWNIDLGLHPNPAYNWAAGYPVPSGGNALDREINNLPIPDGPLAGEILAYHLPPARYVGTVSVVSGFIPKYDIHNKVISITPASYKRVSIPNATLEVANIYHWKNVPLLMRSLERPNLDPDFSPVDYLDDAGRLVPASVLDPEDPIDITADDIAQGFVEYYESLSPGFKSAACYAIATSDWSYSPAWCGASGCSLGVSPCSSVEH